jgi:DNA-binding transcriptional LysR family regulator
MHFDLTDLRLFLHVVEEGSITAGAARSGLALASASARVRGMEEQARVPLLERGRRGVEPTPAGRTLLHHARLVTGQVERMRGELGEYARGLKGHVRLLANTAAAAEFLPEILAAFLAANPSVDVDLDERPSPEVAQAVAEGLAEVGIAADHVNLSGLVVMPFRTDRLTLVVPRGHPLADRGQVAFAEALGSEFVGLSCRWRTLRPNATWWWSCGGPRRCRSMRGAWRSTLPQADRSPTDWQIRAVRR